MHPLTNQVLTGIDRLSKQGCYGPFAARFASATVGPVALITTVVVQIILLPLQLVGFVFKWIVIKPLSSCGVDNQATRFIDKTCSIKGVGRSLHRIGGYLFLTIASPVVGGVILPRWNFGLQVLIFPELKPKEVAHEPPQGVADVPQSPVEEGMHQSLDGVRPADKCRRENPEGETLSRPEPSSALPEAASESRIQLEPPADSEIIDPKIARSAEEPIVLQLDPLASNSPLIEDPSEDQSRIPVPSSSFIATSLNETPSHREAPETALSLISADTQPQEYSAILALLKQEPKSPEPSNSFAKASDPLSTSTSDLEAEMSSDQSPEIRSSSSFSSTSPSVLIESAEGTFGPLSLFLQEEPELATEPLSTQQVEQSSVQPEPLFKTVPFTQATSPVFADSVQESTPGLKTEAPSSATASTQSELLLGTESLTSPVFAASALESTSDLGTELRSSAATSAQPESLSQAAFSPPSEPQAPSSPIAQLDSTLQAAASAPVDLMPELESMSSSSAAAAAPLAPSPLQQALAMPLPPPPQEPVLPIDSTLNTRRLATAQKLSTQMRKEMHELLKTGSKIGIEEDPNDWGRALEAYEPTFQAFFKMLIDFGCDPKLATEVIAAKKDGVRKVAGSAMFTIKMTHPPEVLANLPLSDTISIKVDHLPGKPSALRIRIEFRLAGRPHHITIRLSNKGDSGQVSSSFSPIPEEKVKTIPGLPELTQNALYKVLLNIFLNKVTTVKDLEAIDPILALREKGRPHQPSAVVEQRLQQTTVLIDTVQQWLFNVLPRDSALFFPQGAPQGIEDFEIPKFLLPLIQTYLKILTDTYPNPTLTPTTRGKQGAQVHSLTLNNPQITTTLSSGIPSIAPLLGILKLFVPEMEELPGIITFLLNRLDGRFKDVTNIQLILPKDLTLSITPVIHTQKIEKKDDVEWQKQKSSYQILLPNPITLQLMKAGGRDSSLTIKGITITETTKYPTNKPSDQSRTAAIKLDLEATGVTLRAALSAAETFGDGLTIPIDLPDVEQPIPEGLKIQRPTQLARQKAQIKETQDLEPINFLSSRGRFSLQDLGNRLGSILPFKVEVEEAPQARAAAAAVAEGGDYRPYQTERAPFLQPIAPSSLGQVGTWLVAAREQYNTWKASGKALPPTSKIEIEGLFQAVEMILTTHPLWALDLLHQDQTEMILATTRPIVSSPGIIPVESKQDDSLSEEQLTKIYAHELIRRTLFPHLDDLLNVANTLFRQQTQNLEQFPQMVDEKGVPGIIPLQFNEQEQLQSWIGKYSQILHESPLYSLDLDLRESLLAFSRPLFGAINKILASLNPGLPLSMIPLRQSIIDQMQREIDLICEKLVVIKNELKVIRSKKKRDESSWDQREKLETQRSEFEEQFELLKRELKILKSSTPLETASKLFKDFIIENLESYIDHQSRLYYEEVRAKPLSYEDLSAKKPLLEEAYRLLDTLTDDTADLFTESNKLRAEVHQIIDFINQLHHFKPKPAAPQDE